MSAPRDYSLTFAGPSTQEIRATGRYVRILSADASGAWVDCGGGGELLRYAGQGIDIGARGFSVVRVRVTVASTVKLVISSEHQDDNSANITATISATIGPGGTLGVGGDVSCANLASTPLAGADATRLSLIVKSSFANTYAAGTVRVAGLGVLANQGLEINPGDTLVIDSKAAVSAYNSSGGAVVLQVLAVQQ